MSELDDPELVAKYRRFFSYSKRYWRWSQINMDGFYECNNGQLLSIAQDVIEFGDVRVLEAFQAASGQTKLCGFSHSNERTRSAFATYILVRCQLKGDSYVLSLLDSHSP